MKKYKYSKKQNQLIIKNTNDIVYLIFMRTMMRFYNNGVMSKAEFDVIEHESIIEIINKNDSLS